MKVIAILVTLCALPTATAITKEEAAIDLRKELDKFAPSDAGTCPSNIMDIFPLVTIFQNLDLGDMNVEAAKKLIKTLSEQICPAADGTEPAFGKLLVNCNLDLDALLKSEAFKSLLPALKKALGLPDNAPVGCAEIFGMANIDGLDALCFPSLSLLRTGLCAAVPVILNMDLEGASMDTIKEGIDAFGCLTFSAQVSGSAVAAAVKADVDTMFSCTTNEAVQKMTDEAKKEIPADYKPPANKPETPDGPTQGKNTAAVGSFSALIAATAVATVVSLMA